MFLQKRLFFLKKLACRMETARRFVSLNISLSQSRYIRPTKGGHFEWPWV